MIQELKEKIKVWPFFWKFRSLLSKSIIGNNKLSINGRNNKIQYNSSLLKNSRILIKGNNNLIVFGDKSRLEIDVKIYGNNNLIEIGEDCIVKRVKFWIEDDVNCVVVQRFSTIEESTEIACIEGCSIKIGMDCMLSSDIVIRTGDSHSILDAFGKRINPSKNITVGNHVWIGHKATLNKGVNISANSIVASGAIVANSFDEQNCILAGIPATVLKSNINWTRDRI